MGGERRTRAGLYGRGACVKEKTSESLGRCGGKGRGKQGEMQEGVCFRALPPCAHTGIAVGRAVAVLDRNLSLFSHIKMHAHNSALPLWPHISGNLPTGP